MEYDRDASKPASEDIKVCVFFSAENRISLVYHLERRRITANTREFIKPDTSNETIAPRFDPDCTTAFKVDPSAPDPKVHQLSQLLNQLMEQEQASISEVRS